MSSEGLRRRLQRRARFESFEQRLALSANPLTDIAIEHHNQAVTPIGTPTVPPVEHHLVSVAPTTPELQVVDELPPLQHHVAATPPLQHHVVSSDFTLEQITGQADEVDSHLSDAHLVTGVSDVRTDYGFNGTGQTVVIIDSGIAYDHYNLGGGYGSNHRVVGGWDFAENDSDPYDDGPAGFHGTHVAGIVGSDHSTHTGVASGVDLVALRVFDDDGNGVFSWVEQALDWVHEHRNDFENPITTVNLSLGSTWNSDSIPSWATLENEFAQLEADGIFISVSAGNSFQSYNTTGLSYPAASPYVVPVASITNSGVFSSFSQRHDRVLAAPGSSIASTVPDYVFGADGVPNDFGVASGTSMAAPYVAGAAVLVRQAMEFVSTQNITQDMIYDHLRDTGDTFFDSATNASYVKINVAQAIDQLMPQDDYGDSANAAHNLGLLDGNSSFNGLISRTTDQDYFTFTASATGTLTLATSATHDLTLTATGSTGSFANDELVMNVISGQSYTVSLGSGSGIGYYTVDADLEVAATNLGTVDFLLQNGQNVSNSSAYDLIAARDGILTVESIFDHANGNIDMQLLDSAGNEILTSDSLTDNERLDVDVTGGQTYRLMVSGTNNDVDLRFANLVNVAGDQLTLHGTSADDTLVADARDLSLTINGITYTADEPSTVTSVSIDLGDGNDSAVLHGTSGDEVATVRVGDTTVASSDMTLNLLNTESVDLFGNGGNDSVTFFDTAGDDVFTGDATNSSLNGDGFAHSAAGFNNVTANATTGNDEAVLNDTAGNDTFQGRETSSTMIGSGYSLQANNFDSVVANSTGGTDTAFFYDSSGDDIFEARATSTMLAGSGFSNTANGFATTYGYASGGHDIGYMFDSDGNDHLEARASFTKLEGTGFRNYANGFDVTYSYSSGGTDVAYMYDSAGNDVLEARHNFTKFEGAGFRNYANGFEATYAYSTGGDDVAYMYDSAGADRLEARANFTKMEGNGYRNYANGFGATYGYSSTGADTAYLYDSVGDDRLESRHNFAKIEGNGFRNYANGFEVTYGYASTGNDTAYLYDSTGMDRLEARHNFTKFEGTGFRNYANGFDVTYAYSSNNGDTAYLYDSSGDDRLEARHNFTKFEGSGFRNYANGFDATYAYSSGGNDTAYLYDSAGNDHLEARHNFTKLEGTNFRNYANGFGATYAYSSGGIDSAYLYDSVSNDTFTAGENYTILSGSSFYNYAKGFDQVHSFALSGGNDVATFNKVMSSESLSGFDNEATLVRDSTTQRTVGFDTVRALADTGETPTSDLDAVDYLFEQLGDWQ